MKTNGSSAGSASTGPSGKRAQGSFAPARQKVTICSLDNHKLSVAAQYNPKELGITKAVQWQDPKRLDNRRADQRSPTEAKDTEYTGGGERSMSIEMFFDRYETPVGDGVDTRPISTRWRRSPTRRALPTSAARTIALSCGAPAASVRSAA